jgi:hypothetical protein
MAKQESVELEVMEIVRGQVEFCVLGTSPLIFNRMSDKAQRELLLPKKKSARRSETSLKHDPIAEFHNAAIWLEGEKGKNPNTLMALPSTAFKAAMMTAALDIPGLTKSSIGRMVYVDGENIEIYGTPKLLMSNVRSAGMNKTPDIRTRAIMPEWAARVSVTFVKPQFKEGAITNLMAAAGITAGVGDFRPEKGKGNCGQFKLVAESDKDFKRITKQGYDTQVKATADAEPHDESTRKLLAWFLSESKSREMNATQPGGEVVR